MYYYFFFFFLFFFLFANVFRGVICRHARKKFTKAKEKAEANICTKKDTNCYQYIIGKL